MDVVIHYPDDLFAASGKSREALEWALSVELAIRLFETGELSMGRAAALAGLSKAEFRDELTRQEVSWLNLDSEELGAEFRASRGDYRRG
jgi:predicted HTH domain antitoxin